jgi:hypothetical protein
MARGRGSYLNGSWRYERMEGVSQWTQLNHPQRISELLLEWLEK